LESNEENEALNSATRLKEKNEEALMQKEKQPAENIRNVTFHVTFMFFDDKRSRLQIVSFLLFSILTTLLKFWDYPICPVHVTD
jgi:hypothetical protein